ncbi:hypothetical protein HPB48_026504 [Haemaphysalis longicornis]|uniref:Uncharacterized protein n=1 Tax=Haemaphysalis longicornis TaxID=44386 RepID=A0A9J6HCB9_HAELO|nr:hypothetical protein HPB48_026504 [Haemaphysalis longicornis]
MYCESYEKLLFLCVFSYLASGQYICNVALAYLSKIVYRIGSEGGLLNLFRTIISFYQEVCRNAFGIAAARWRILLRTLQLLPRNVDYVVKAACVLRNFLAVLNEESEQILDQEDRFGNVVPGRWRQGIQQMSGQEHVDPCYFPLEETQSGNFNTEAADARTLFSAYVWSALERYRGSGTNQASPKKGPSSACNSWSCTHFAEGKLFLE